MADHPDSANPNPFRPEDVKAADKLAPAVTSSQTSKKDEKTGEQTKKTAYFVNSGVQRAIDSLGSVSRGMQVRMTRSQPELDNQLALYAVILKTTDRLSFNRYNDFLKSVLSLTDPDPKAPQGPLSASTKTLRDSVNWNKGPVGLSNYSGTRAYSLVKDATELFVQSQCGVLPPSAGALKPDFTKMGDEVGDNLDREDQVSDANLAERWDSYLNSVEGGQKDTLPYLQLIAQKLGVSLNDDAQHDCLKCAGILAEKLKNPCLIELIWSYWMEQGMVVQSINALAMRFQNQRTADTDVLARFDLDPLRPINNLLWGYIQDEINRLTVVRRAYEYDHHYGLRLQGRAIPGTMRPADSRTRFLESFHNLLRECARYYRAITNTFVHPDTYAAVNALKELQLILTEGMHNQYGDLPSTARVEMLVQQGIMARPEMLQFVGGRTMVPYAEPWMMYVDAIRQMHGWGDVGVRHFVDLANYGEQILLAVRFGNWATSHDEPAAAVFMSTFREHVQAYIHAYRAVTGIDLGVMDDVRPVDNRALAAQPSDLIVRRNPKYAPATQNGRLPSPRLPVR